MNWLNELRLAVRVLAHRRSFALAVVATMTLGIAATTAIFSVAHAVLFRPLPFASPDRLVHLFEAAQPAPPPGSRLVVRPGNYYDWKSQTHSFASMGAVAPRFATLAAASSAQLLWTHRVTDGLFETLGVAPAKGRTFEPGEYEMPGGAPVVVLSHHLWQTAFGANPDMLGQRALIDDRVHTIVGVMPPGFYPTMSGRVDAWFPLYIEPGKRNSRVDWMLQPIARMRDDVTIEQARADLDAVARRVAAQFPVDGRPLTGGTISADEVVLGPQRPLFTLLLVASVLLLVIASVNVAGLLLVRGIDRSRELALHMSLGASPLRLVRRVLAESTLLTLGGGVLGTLLASAIVPAVLTLLPDSAFVPRLEEVRIDRTAAVLASAVAMAVGIAAGGLPAWIALRTRTHVLGTERSVAGDRRRGRTQAILVVTQIAVSMVLLLAAGLVLRSFARLRTVDPGIRTADVLTMQLRAPAERYSDEARQWALFEDVEARLRGLPGVEDVGLGASLPFEHGFNPWSYLKPGQSAADAMTTNQRASIQRVSPGYFAALGMPVIAGRTLESADRASRPRVMVINETMARHGWPNGDAVGSQVEVDLTSRKIPLTIVGVVRDARLKGPQNEIRGEMFWPLAQSTVPNVNLFVRTRTPPLAIFAAAREQVQNVDANVPMVNPRVMTKVFDDSLWRPRVASTLFGVFAIAAVTLAALGLYGVQAYSVSRRRREIGIRMALGDRSDRVFRRVARQGLTLTAIGVAIGLLAAAVAAPSLRALVGRDSLLDGLTLSVAMALLLGVALVACAGPALRAAHVDPAQVLRAE